MVLLILSICSIETHILLAGRDRKKRKYRCGTCTGTGCGGWGTKVKFRMESGDSPIIALEKRKNAT